tara:strand:- start:9325 stop:9843 length:519 start_codon:yes stop_codon:yes gene_type:complete
MIKLEKNKMKTSFKILAAVVVALSITSSLQARMEVDEDRGLSYAHSVSFNKSSLDDPGQQKTKKASTQQPSETIQKKETSKKLALGIATTFISDFTPESIKNTFNIAVTKTNNELVERQNSGKKNSSTRKFFTGFKHGFLETTKLAAKAGVKVIKEHGLDIARFCITAALMA